MVGGTLKSISHSGWEIVRVSRPRKLLKSTGVLGVGFTKGLGTGLEACKRLGMVTRCRRLCSKRIRVILGARMLPKRSRNVWEITTCDEIISRLIICFE